MKIHRIPPLILAIGLQLLPLTRVVCLTQTAAPSGIAVVCRWLAAAAVVLGGYHTVSGASAAIAGLANTNPRGPVTSNVTAQVNQPFSYRVIVTNPGVNPGQAYYSGTGLPPGLTINTNLGGTGLITGTPTAAGVYPVVLGAGNANTDLIVYFSATIKITSGVDPPSIATQPQDQIALTGTNVVLSVNASGTGLTYQWRFNSNNLATATAASLTLPSVTPAQSGYYSVVVSNGGGGVTSANAHLLVVAQPDASIAPTLHSTAAGTGLITLSFATLPGYRYLLEYSDGLGLGTWTLLTNVPPAFVGGTLNRAEDLKAPSLRFYRVLVSGN